MAKVTINENTLRKIIRETLEEVVNEQMLNEQYLTKWDFEKFYKQILAYTKQNPCKTPQEAEQLVYRTVTSSPYYDQNSVYDFYEMLGQFAHMRKEQFFQACMNQQMNQKATPNAQQTWVQRGTGRQLTAPSSPGNLSYVPNSRSY